MQRTAKAAADLRRSQHRYDAQDMTYEEILKFHGHECPGIAIGYRMAEAAMEELALLRAADEELVAIVENDACGVDAVQCLTGCTFGKGNLIFRDYGKHVYTLYSRKSHVGVRVCLTAQRFRLMFANGEMSLSAGY
jgi:formylmethanofuran dehydrogenase subunit E